MATNLVQEGKLVQYTTGAAESYDSGDLIWIGGMPGVAIADIGVSSTGSVALSGVWELPKHNNATPTNGTTFAVGDPVYWDAVNERCCATCVYPRVGFATQAAGGSGTTVKVLLSGSNDVFTVEAGEAIDAGELLYVSGWNATLGLLKVGLADADVAAGTQKQVAVLVALEDIASGEKGKAGKTYLITGVDSETTTSAAGDPVYLSGTAGGWTGTRPTTAGDSVQNVGTVLVRATGTGGTVLIHLGLSGTVTIKGA